ncbi:60S ribosomal protein L17 [Mycena venus]|uniref:60S ribosomal protein L17 n=1 Tax=Mycena venus TaxID=2733690 RepID=A0A8H6YRZ3_9AGAR|nr:60S ribosomal protein L17 [Mycena venus]
MGNAAAESRMFPCNADGSLQFATPVLLSPRTPKRVNSVHCKILCVISDLRILQLRAPGASTSALTSRTCVRSQLLSLASGSHFKQRESVGLMFASGLKLTKAYTYLADVKEHKQVIPFRRFSGGVGRASQAKQFKATQGRWPEKSVKFILRLLKNAESNADAKNIDLEDLIIKNIVVQQAPKTRRRTYRAHGRINPYQGHPCHVEIILAAGEVEVEKATDKVATSLAGLNRRQVARKRIEAARE